MGLSLGPTMANIFLSFYELKWLQQCPKKFEYVDDIFVFFESVENLSKICDYFNTCHPNISFCITERKGCNGDIS